MAIPLKVVVFCGAGFSVAAGYPTMAQFSDRLRHADLMSGTEIAALDSIIAHCSDMSALLGGSSRNIEQIASFLSMLQLSRPGYVFRESGEYNDPGKALALVKRALSRVYRPSSTEPRTSGDQLFHMLNNYSLTMVTTNYDLNIELGAARLGIGIDMADDIREAARFQGSGLDFNLYASTLAKDNALCGKRLSLFKLHGSVNWYDSSAGMIVSDRIRVDTSSRMGTSYTRFELLNVDGSGNPFPEDDVAIVPPTVLKTGGFDRYRLQWEGAAKAMSTADVLAFVGYSFPESDTFMRYFLAASLHRNSRLQKLLLVDPNAQEIASRLLPLLSHPQHVAIWQAIPLEWPWAPLAQIIEGSWMPTHTDQAIQMRQQRLKGERLLRGDYPEPELPILRSPRGRG